jgi:hypothetical protein
VLVSQRGYARARGVSRSTVYRHTVPGGGPIPVHGPRHWLDPDEADRLWLPGERGPDAGDHPSDQEGRVLELAKLRRLRAVTELKQLELDRRRAQLVSRAGVEELAARFQRMVLARWRAWPATVAPEIAAAFGLDTARVLTALQPYVDALVDQLSQERLEL